MPISTGAVFTSMFEPEHWDRMDAISPPNMQQMPWRTVTSPSGFTHTAWNACPLPLLFSCSRFLACWPTLPAPFLCPSLISGTRVDKPDYSWPLHSLFTLALWNWLFVCPVGSMAAGPADLDFRVGAVMIAVQLPVKANLSSSIFFLRCLISKSLSFSNLYNRPFSSTFSRSWSRSCSISSSSTLQGKGRITGAQASMAQVCCPWLGTGWWLELFCIKQEGEIKGNLNEQIFSILFSKQWSRTHAHKWKEQQALNAVVY